MLLGLSTWGATGHAQTTEACVARHQEAQELRLAGQLTAALDALQSCAAAACPGPVRADCGAWHREVSQSVPTVQVTARGADGSQPPALSARVDGQAPVAVDDTPLRLDPGTHTIVVEAPGYAPFKHEVTVVAGERQTLAAELVPVPASAQAADGSDSTVPLASWILGGVAVAGLAAGATLGILGKSKLDELEDRCGQGCVMCQPAQACSEESDRGRNYYNLANVGFGVAAAAAAAALVVWGVDSNLWGLVGDESSAPSQALLVGVDPANLRLSVTGVF